MYLLTLTFTHDIPNRLGHNSERPSIQPADTTRENTGIQKGYDRDGDDDSARSPPRTSWGERKDTSRRTPHDERP